MEPLKTLSEIIIWLQQQGYGIDLNNQLAVLHSEPEGFEVHAVYRFEGMTDPGDELILYALYSHKYALKGILTNAYGMYADARIVAIEQKLHLPPVHSDHRITS